MKKFILSLLLMAIVSVSFAQGKRNPKHQKAFVHTVYFWLKDKDSKSAKDSLYQGIMTLMEIKEIKEAFVGTPAETRRPVIDHTFSFSNTFIFKNKADQDAYQAHPIHLLFVKNYSHLYEKVLVYDAEGL